MIDVIAAQTKYQLALEHERRLRGALREAEEAVHEALDELRAGLVQQAQETHANRS